ncbi:MAG TPA: FtsX-like permease family protein [Anaerolineae bacterium]|nr:FtsX-like permease family protein [Anaerolineae bacterium]
MFVLKLLLRLWDSWTIALKRLLAQRGLALAILLGLVIVIALVMSIPLYAEATYYRMLSAGLFSATPQYRGLAVRPPVALLFRYSGSFTVPQQWEGISPLDTYFQAQVYRDLALQPAPNVPGARLFNTGTFGLFSVQDAAKVTEIQPAYRIGLACIGQPEQHIKIIEGDFPADATTSAGAFDVALNRSIADKMGVQLGETYIAYDLRALHSYEAQPAQFEVRITGIWEPVNPRAEFWEYSQLPLDNLLFVSETTFANRISPALDDEIYQALWYLPMDAEKIYVGDIEPLLSRIELLRRTVTHILAGTILDIDSIKILEQYQASANNLTTLLFAFSVPIISLIVAFIVLVVTLTVEQHRNQIAVLRSRGATVAQVSRITAWESVTLGIIALVAALPVSLLLAYTIGQVRSFLNFSLATDLRVGMTWATARFGVAAMIFTLVAQVIPTVGAARHTIVTYKQERARALRPPWWQRVWLDGLLLIPAGYGAYRLRQQGGLMPSTEALASAPLQDPLLFLVPALSLFALALLIMRLLPWLMKALAWLGAQTRSVGFLLAARQLARAPGFYTAPLGLLILTLSLATYTASLSATLETHLHDQQFYGVGADVSLVDTGDATGGGDMMMASSLSTAGTSWHFLPVSEYRALPGVEAAARVGRYRALVQTGHGFQAGTFIGVDRVDFPQVAFWRADFAPVALGELMNQLAITENGVLLPRDFMETYIFNVGDTVNVTVVGYETSVVLSLKIVGSFDYFPTWYPDTGPLVVGNLDYYFMQAQSQLPYQVWLNTEPDVNDESLADAMWAMDLGAQDMRVTSQRILKAQQQPERQGLLGFLSVGFGAAAILTALGFILYALSSFRRRAVELGVLRAVGLSTRHMTSFVAWELIFLLVIGSAAGTGLGIWASHTFVPYLQMGADATAYTPPFVVEIAWPAILRLYILFAALFVIALGVLVRSLVKMKLFQAIKMGETV